MEVLLGKDREPGATLPLAQQFRFDAGSPALNLLATLGFRGSTEPVERLGSPERLADWLAANGLPVVTVDARAVDQARGLREAAYATLRAAMLGTEPAAADLATVSRWAAMSPPVRALTVDAGGVAWTDTQPTIDTLLGGLARELAGLAVDTPPALRHCAADTCLMLYLDRSRGRRRTWCSMGRCGNAAKVARHRHQHASRSTGSP